MFYHTFMVERNIPAYDARSKSHYSKQDKVCGICGSTVDPLVRDHSHTCCPEGIVNICCLRGLLCKRCNLWLTAAENKEWLTKALAYLKKWQ